MKKFYTTLCAMALMAAAAPTASAAPAMDEILGYYDLEYTPADWSSNCECIRITLRAGEGDNVLLFNGIYEDYDVVTYYDPATGVITVPNQTLDADKGITLKGVYYDIVTSEMTLLDYSYTMKYVKNGFAFDMVGDSFTIFDKDENTLFAGIDYCGFHLINMDEENWNVLPDKAQFTDGWLVGSSNEHTQPYEVTVWQNKANPYLIAIVDPYGPGTPFAEINKDTEGKGFIVLDITTQDCVRVKTRIYSGLTLTLNVQSGLTTYEPRDCQFFPYNADEILCFNYGYEADVLAEKMHSQGLTTSEIDGREIFIKDCIYGTQYSRYGDYTFGNNANALIELGGDLPGVSYPDKPNNVGIEAITASDNAAAPAEYFNLQGVRVAQPQAGNIYIERRGTSARTIRY